MICDTAFASHCLRAQVAGKMRCARRFAALKRWTLYRFHPAIVETATG